MRRVDLLSDTIYCQQAVKQLHQLLGGANEFPVKATQVYGLRQIARQEPEKVEIFAGHQRERAERKYETASQNGQQRLKFEIEFWTLVADLCNGTTSNWSVILERDSHIPADLQSRSGMSRREGKELRERRKEWDKQWDNEHIPAFFERFCTHCLYCIGKAEMGQLGGEDTAETHQQTQQEQSEGLGQEAMHAAFQQANLSE